jgi:hypothetical protein
MVHDEGMPQGTILHIAHLLECFELDLAGSVVKEEGAQRNSPRMIQIEEDYDEGPHKRETRPHLAWHQWNQGRVIGNQELGIGDGCCCTAHP